MSSHRDHLARVEEDFSTEYPGADGVASECVVNLIRAGDRLATEISRRLRHEANLSLTALMVLATIDGLQGCATPSEIAEHVPVTSAAVTSLLDTVERRDLVRRQPHASDRRKVEIALTDEGRRIVDRILPGLHRLEARAMDALSSAERETFLDLLAKVLESVDEAGQEPPELETAPRIRPARLDPARDEPQ